jgi:hypothetical protein
VQVSAAAARGGEVLRRQVAAGGGGAQRRRAGGGAHQARQSHAQRGRVCGALRGAVPRLVDAPSDLQQPKRVLLRDQELVVVLKNKAAHSRLVVLFNNLLLVAHIKADKYEVAEVFDLDGGCYVTEVDTEELLCTASPSSSSTRRRRAPWCSAPTTPSATSGCRTFAARSARCRAARRRRSSPARATQAGATTTTTRFWSRVDNGSGRAAAHQGVAARQSAAR